MPFTPAHAAVVMPLVNQRWFSATALIIGSMAPDFEYFFKVSVSGEHGHTWWGLLYFDLPTTLALSLVFHRIVKWNLISNLPPFLQRRFQDTLRLDFMQYLKHHWMIFIFAALVGATSHIVWDSFTHNSGSFPQTLPLYHHKVFGYPMFYALQHISTAVGLTVISLMIAFKHAEDCEVFPPKLIYWLLIAGITGAVMVARSAVDSWDTQIGNGVVSFISGFCLAVILTGFFNFRHISIKKRHGQEDAMGAGRKT